MHADGTNHLSQWTGLKRSSASLCERKWKGRHAWHVPTTSWLAMSVCVYICVWCVCVCVCARERESESLLDTLQTVFLLLRQGLGVRCGGAVLWRTSGDLWTTAVVGGFLLPCPPGSEPSNLSGATCSVSASGALWPCSKDALNGNTQVRWMCFSSSHTAWTLTKVSKTTTLNDSQNLRSLWHNSPAWAGRVVTHTLV